MERQREALGEELVSAAWRGDAERVRYLVERDADVNAKGERGYTALILAAAKGHIEVVRHMTEQNIDVNARNEYGDTALIRAAANGRIGVVRYLTERGANVNAKNKERNTALIEAAAGNQAEVVRFLISTGARVDAANGVGDTAIHIAAKRGHQEVVHVLLPFTKTSQRQLRHHIPATHAPSSRSSSWLIPPLEIEILQFVDKENVGGDYRAKWLDADVVVKLFVPYASSATFADEVRVWQQLRHPNIIKLYGACDKGGLQFFVCEYSSNGSLDDYLKSCEVEQQTPWRLLHQAALGLEFLHERRIVHGDLRCRNILVGSDGVVKLANFWLSGPTRAIGPPRLSSQFVGSMRWQSPERLKGEQASFASDIYSLGMCIVEAVTGDLPWGGEHDVYLRYTKKRWDPEGDTDAFDEPPGLAGDARALVLRMCCQDPGKRMSITSVVYELECLAAKDDAQHGDSRHPTLDTTCNIDAYNIGETTKLWLAVQNLVNEHGDQFDLCQEFEDLGALFHRLQAGSYHPSTLKWFDELLIDFHTALKTLQSAEQVRIMQLSATRTTNHRIRAFERRIGLLWRMLDDSTHETHAREERWAEQRSRQIEFFVSEVSKTWLLLNELESAEERSAFLAFLRDEMKNDGSNYSEGQLAVMHTAYEDVASHMGPDTLVNATPEWFIPWYELQFDQWSSCLGKGAFGSVHRAKWLDSDVVVKQVILAGESESQSSCSPFESWMSRSQSVAKPPSVTDPAAKAKPAEAMLMFKREADIWFGLSHPHVVRLFGACHVGSPFFVCEYATNGTLVDYLRQHPDQLWRLLHQAALGVQYLHERKIVHGDLKGNNIVIGSDKKAKVTDFGLSSTVSSSDETAAQITGAWHWVAPECLVGKGARPTFASDVFSLGMCVIEASRVVDSLQHTMNCLTPPPLPWGNLGNLAVKANLSRGKLPARPTVCTDDQWALVTRMCSHNPAARMKISTVVDKLAQLVTSSGEELQNATGELVSRHGNHIIENKRLPSPRLPEVIAAMKELLERLHGNGMLRFSRKLKKNLLGRVDRRVEIWQIYRWLWNRLELVHAHIVDNEDINSQDELLALVETARVRTTQLPDVGHSLGELTEATLHGYALHRRLDKYISADFLCTTESKWASFYSWTAAAILPPP